MSCLLVLILLAWTSVVGAQENDLPVLQGPYLGQVSPGMTPMLFAEGIIASDLHGCPIFTPDGTEAYWKPMSVDHMMCSRMVDGYWNVPRKFELPDEFADSDVPCL